MAGKGEGNIGGEEERRGERRGREGRRKVLGEGERKSWWWAIDGGRDASRVSRASHVTFFGGDVWGSLFISLGGPGAWLEGEKGSGKF